MVHEGRAFVTIGWDDYHPPDLGNLACVDLATGQKVWDFQGIGGSFSTPVALEDLVLASDLSGFIYCLDSKSGQVIWRFETWSATYASPLLVDEHLYLGNEDGDMTIISVRPLTARARSLGATVEVLYEETELKMTTKDGRHETVTGAAAENLVRVRQFPDRLSASPIFANGTLYVANRCLYAIKSSEKRE